MSSIAYARQCSSSVVLPDLAIAAMARFGVALLSRVPLPELEGGVFPDTAFNNQYSSPLNSLSGFMDWKLIFLRAAGCAPWWGQGTLVIGDEA